MIELVSRNIQWGPGLDGVVDLARIVDTVMAIGEADIICFQEVTRDLTALAGNDGADQPAVIAGLLPDFEAVYGPGHRRPPSAAPGRGSDCRTPRAALHGR